MRTETFENFIADERGAETVEALKSVCASPEGRLILLYGRSGAGKTHLCRAYLAAAVRDTIYCSADTIRLAFSESLRKGGKEMLFDAFAPFDLLLEDLEYISFSFRTELLSELVRRQTAAGRLVVATVAIAPKNKDAMLSDPRWQDAGLRILEVPTPDRETLRAYARRKLAGDGVEPTEAVLDRLLNDRRAATVSGLNGLLLDTVAAVRYAS